MRENNSFSNHFEIRVIKNIPTESGLGGGSSNAGVIINYLCKTYDLEVPSNEDIAKKIGSDVPFFVEGKAALVSGIGEKVDVKDRTSIIIAHRLSTIKNVDKIIL